MDQATRNKANRLTGQILVKMSGALIEAAAAGDLNGRTIGQIAELLSDRTGHACTEANVRYLAREFGVSWPGLSAVSGEAWRHALEQRMREAELELEVLRRSVVFLQRILEDLAPRTVEANRTAQVDPQSAGLEIL